MNAFLFRDGQLYAEDVALEALAARFGTPCYVYSRRAITDAWREFSAACAGRRVLVCYALKANSNLAVIDLLAREQAGFDIVSAGELRRVLAAGGSAARTVFSGVGKSSAEIREALTAGVRCFNVESQAELERLDQIAGEMGRRAPVSLRVNPDVDAGTHPYISTGLATSGLRSRVSSLSPQHSTRCSSSWTACTKRGSSYTTSTWAGVWASAMTTRRRPRGPR